MLDIVKVLELFSSNLKINALRSKTIHFFREQQIFSKCYVSFANYFLQFM